MTDQEISNREELQTRISAHLQHRNNSATVKGLWQGYLLALVEWHVISDETFGTLNQQLLPTEKMFKPGSFVSQIAYDESDTGIAFSTIKAPTADDLVDLMEESVGAHGDTEQINVVWQGYLAGLQEWRFLKIRAFDYHSMRRLLRTLPRDEISEIFMGVPEDSQGGL